MENAYKFYGNEKTSHIGEERIMNNGQKAKIIDYRNWNDIDLEFEEGTIVYNKCYQNFQHGEILNPNYRTIRDRFSNKWIGKTKIANNKMPMKIVAYRNAQDIDVEFLDETLIEHTRMIQFNRGKIKNPNFNFILKDFMILDGNKYYFVLDVNKTELGIFTIEELIKLKKVKSNVSKKR